MPLTTGQWPLGYYSDVKGRHEYSWGPPRHSIVNGEYFPFCIHWDFTNPLQNEWATLVETLIWWLGHLQLWKGDTLYTRDEGWNRATLGHKKSVHHWYIDLPAVLPKCCKKESFFHIFNWSNHEPYNNWGLWKSILVLSEGSPWFTCTLLYTSTSRGSHQQQHFWLWTLRWELGL